ncbi:hypothetical protein MBLNU459_g2171t2 [Dothideomycetes sp. NU459]
MAGKRRRDVNADEERAVDITHPSRKRRIEYTEADAKLASLYNELSEDVKALRLKAAAELIRTLSESDGAQIDRALTRLIRGLCSNRKSARSGFSVALTEVLRLTSVHQKGLDGVDLSLSAIVERIVSICDAEGKSTKQESRDHLLGRCFGLKSLVQSQLLFQKGVPIVEWEKILDLIFNLASETTWLRRECGVTLYESLTTLSQVKGIDVEYASLLMNKFGFYKLDHTPPGIACWLKASDLFPASLPKGVWDHNDPLSPKERMTVAKILRDNNGSQTEDGSTQANKSGSAQTTPSFAWQVVFTHLYQRHTPKSKKPSDFEKFWIDAVDNSLFAASASTERKALGLQIVSLGITTAPTSLLPCIFTPNVMRCIINQRAEKERYLHEAAKAPLQNMILRAKADQDAIPILLKGLLSEHGAIDFDRITKTKTVDELLNRSASDSAEHSVRILSELVANPNTDDSTQAETRRRMLADMFLSLGRKGKQEGNKTNLDGSRDSSSWLAFYTEMCEFAYGGPRAGRTESQSGPSPPLSGATQQIFQARLMSILNHVLSSRVDEQFQIPEIVVNCAASADTRSSTGLRVKADKQVLKVVNGAQARLKEFHALEKKGNKKAAIRAFKALYSLSVLQAYNSEPDIIPVLEDLDLAYSSWQKNADASIMLVEILLSFISKPSAVYRKLAQQVFGAFASQLDGDGLNSMLDILEKKENLTGQQELFEQGDDDEAEEAEEEDVEVESEDGEDDSDVEVMDVEDASDVEIDEASQSDSDIEASENDDSEEEEVDGDKEDGDEANGEDAEFERKLADALRASGAAPGSDSDDSDMDDEQMMALEGHLTTIFKERKKQSNKKKDNKDAKENIVNFKNRVLDLLIIYAKQEHANAQALELILPMLSLIKTTSSKQISEKAFSLLQQYFAACNKDKQLPDINTHVDALEILQAVFADMRANASKLHSNACSRSALFLAKTIINKDSKHYAEIADLYNDLQKEWYRDPKSHIQPSIFTEWTSWSIATRKNQHY